VRDVALIGKKACPPYTERDDTPTLRRRKKEGNKGFLLVVSKDWLVGSSLFVTITSLLAYLSNRLRTRRNKDWITSEISSHAFPALLPFFLSASELL